MNGEGAGMWLKIDDNFVQHPKVIGLSHPAFRLHLQAMVYSAQHLTDGHIAKASLKGRGATKALVAELVAARLWEVNDDGWVIHDWLDWNPSAAEVQQRRKSERERLRDLRRKRREQEDD